jgi:hypothetical protein
MNQHFSKLHSYVRKTYFMTAELRSTHPRLSTFYELAACMLADHEDIVQSISTLRSSPHTSTFDKLSTSFANDDEPNRHSPSSKAWSRTGPAVAFDE